MLAISSTLALCLVKVLVLLCLLKFWEVWNYLANVLANGKAIVSLFLDLPYVYFLVQSVVFMWSAMLVLELIAWIFRLIKLQF
jgi:hypothetical protein